MQLAMAMREAATRLIESFDPSQQERALLPFELEGERTTWFYTPTDHGGLPLNAMTPRQQERVHQLLAVSLSAGGHHTVNLIMGLENILAAETAFADMSLLPAAWRTRDPGRYFVAFFDTPNAARWGWRFGGHHVSLNYSLSGDAVRGLPSFLGAHPATSHGVGPNVFRPLAGEEDLGRELVRALRTEQRTRAVLSEHAPGDHVTGRAARLVEGIRPSSLALLMREPPPAEIAAAFDARYQLSETELKAIEYSIEPKGLPVADFDSAQRDLFYAVLRQYLDRMPAEVASEEMQRVRALDPSRLTFAWAGGIEIGEPHYHRIQGDSILIEYDRVQNDANHIHTVWRDPSRDFGRDLLAAHYAEAHAAAAVAALR